MFELPSSTAFGRRIPKQKFYDNLTVTPELKRCFVEQISAIIWKNKIAPATANIAAGETVTEIEVFEIRLNQKELSQSVLELIDREIPYHILFLLTFEDEQQAWIGYKEAAQSGNNAFKVTAYYHTEWTAAQDVTLRLEGLDTDAVYENFVRQIAGDQLKTAGQDERSLQEAVALSEKRKKLKKQIDALQKKVDNEKQFNKRVEMNGRLRALRKQLEDC